MNGDLLLACAYCGRRYLRRTFKVPVEACCTDCLPATWPRFTVLCRWW